LGHVVAISTFSAACSAVPFQDDNETYVVI
jgi:hypothetical protein